MEFSLTAFFQVQLTLEHEFELTGSFICRFFPINITERVQKKRGRKFRAVETKGMSGPWNHEANCISRLEMEQSLSAENW